MILTLLEERSCTLCGNTLYPGQFLCGECLTGIQFLDTPASRVCQTCGSPEVLNIRQCRNCQEQVHLFKENKSLFYYRDRGALLLHEFKFRNCRFFDSWFARRISDSIMSAKGQLLLVPAPTTIRNGCRPIWKVVDLISGITGLSVQPEIIRKKGTQSQKGLSFPQRLNNLRGNLSWSGSKLEGKTIILLDDVFTTGATADACTELLLSAGADCVIVRTIALD